VRRTRTWWSTILATLLLGASAGASAWGLFGAGLAFADGTRTFSAQEQKDLNAGRLVVRSETRSVGDAHLVGGLAWQVIDAEVTQVWATLADVTTYAGFLPAVSEAKRVARLAHAERIFIRHRYSVVDASYYVLMSPDAAHGRLPFHLDHTQPSAISDAYGELRVSPFGAGRSVVSFAIMVDVGDGLWAGLLRGEIHKWLLRVPEQLARYMTKQKRLGRTPGPRGPDTSCPDKALLN
jgi:hypothetical protein